MLKKNVTYKKYKKISPWRKISLGTWSTIKNPEVYGWIDIDARPVLDIIDEFKKRGLKITPTTVVAKACAVAIGSTPGLNGVVRLGRVYQRKNVDVFLQVSDTNQYENLTGVLVRQCDQKRLELIAQEIKEFSQKYSRGEDESFGKSKNILNFVPGFLMAPIINLLGIVLYGLNLWTPLLGMPKDGFGSVMVTSVGMLGIDRGFAPLVPYSRCPMVVAVGKISDEAKVENGEVVIKKIMPVCVTADHRLLDGLGASLFSKNLKNYLQKPF